MEYNDIENGSMEDALKGAIYSGSMEKTNHDKILSQHDMYRLRQIVSKEFFNVEDISEVQNILVSKEIKLTNLEDWDRYVIGKYYIWLGEYGKRYSKALRAKVFYKKHWKELTNRTKDARAEIEKEYAETYKTCIHVFCYLIRTPLSIEGTLIDKLTTDRKEIEYSGIQNPVQPQQPQQQWRG